MQNDANKEQQLLEQSFKFKSPQPKQGQATQEVETAQFFHERFESREFNNGNGNSMSQRDQ